MRLPQQKSREGDGYLAALINFRFIANGVWTTDETLKRLTRPSPNTCQWRNASGETDDMNIAGFTRTCLLPTRALAVLRGRPHSKLEDSRCLMSMKCAAMC